MANERECAANGRRWRLAMNGQLPKLTRITIEGFRSIRYAELALGDVTVLIGANGAGKSNALGFTKMLSHMMSESLSSLVRTW